jgi:DNA (cytosine-5)-methyltransferase 1
MKTLYELFAGSGASRLGFGSNWECVFANEISKKKGDAYAANFGRAHLFVCDIADVSPHALPGRADSVGLSPPCVGHSEAGNRGGFDEAQSRAFWPAWEKIEALDTLGRAPLTAAFENVSGIKPENLRAVQAAFTRAHYPHATRMVDAKYLVPQSRERVIIIGAHRDLNVDPEPVFDQAMKALKAAPKRSVGLNDLFDFSSRFREYSTAQVAHHLAMLSAASVKEIAKARALGRPVAFAFARRSRYPNGKGTSPVQTVEIRTGDIANALKLPSAGGSSHQFLFFIDGDKTYIRAINPREAAKLTGLPDDYILPRDPIAALDICGDAVFVDVVRFLARQVIEPLLDAAVGARIETPESLPSCGQPFPCGGGNCQSVWSTLAGDQNGDPASHRPPQCRAWRDRAQGS